LILQKGRPQQKKIIIGVAEEMGHDHWGKAVFRYDKEKEIFTKELWDDMEVIRKELESPNSKNNKNVFTVDISDIKNDLYVPRYYWNRKIEDLEEEAEKQNLKFIQIQKLMDEKIIEVFKGHGSPPSEFKGKGDIPYVRAGDIGGWELYKNPKAMVPYEVYKSVKGKGIDLKPKDIVFVKEGSYRIGSVALVSKFDLGILLNHHSLVFRVIDENNKYGIDAFYLLYLFSHNLTQRQLYNKVMIDTTLPNIGERWKELYLPISKNDNTIVTIKERVRKLFENKWESIGEITNLRKDFGDFTT
jgi:type I restriction enzyme M protein